MSRSAAVDRLAGLGMLVGGEWVRPAGAGVLRSVDPTTEEVVAEVPDASAADVDVAVAVAEQALPAWSATPPTARGALLLALADLVERHEAELAEIDTVDTGNPLAAMLEDVRAAVRQMRMFAGLATEIKGRSGLHGNATLSYELREPYGVVGRITAFNHPLLYAAGKAAAALVSGNTVLLKPSDHTPLSTLRLAELTRGLLPDGVLNVVTGSGPGAGAALAAHPRVPRISYTGGVPGGKAVLHAGVDAIKHVTLELGGKNPMIVFADVDPVRAARAAVVGMNFARSQGQSCQSNSRVFVHEAVHDRFVEALLEAVAALRVGDPLEEGSDLGPVSYRAHFERVLGYIDAGLAEGATLLAGGGALDRPGFFVRPTVFGDVEDGMAIAREEIFGPVLSVIRWSDLDDVVRRANDTPFGLTANIWTDDMRQAHRTAHRIQAGYVWVNGTGRRVPGTPFGGYKQSGLGKESSLEEVLEFTRHKVVAVELG